LQRFNAFLNHDKELRPMENLPELVTGQVSEQPTPQVTGIEAFADVKRMIVIAAHPDDLEVVCGGTIALLADQGVEIISVNCTLGDIGTQERELARQALATTRLAEAEAAAELLGIKAVHNLGRHDGELLPDLELRAQIARLYRLTQADTLLTFDPFWAGQIHPDHRAAGQAALDAYMPSKMPLYRPEQLTEPGTDLGRIERVFLFSTDRAPDIYVDITAVQSRKFAACVAHKSQFLQGEEGLDWLRAMDAESGAAIGAAAGEAFKSLRVW
jgi:LmbE family N-acetylglucosaminyl deacetylase